MSVDTPALTISVPPADDLTAVDQWHDIHMAVRKADIPDFPPPCRYGHGVEWHTSFPGSKVVRAMAYLGDTPVGTLKIELPLLDNLDNADVEVSVLPEYRRRGIGRALFEYALGVLKAENRKTFNSPTVEPIPGGPARDEAGGAFARALGMSNALPEIRRRLDLSTVEPGLHDRLLAQAWPHASGYSAVSWVGATPEEYIDDVARLNSSFLEEAPLGDLQWEPEVYDADRIRKSDETSLRYGRRRYTTVIRHDASGRLVATSVLVMLHSFRHHAWQGVTLVHPAHRGHRLGVVSKVENLRHALRHEPELREIDTWNAEVNAHMIAINEAMGFRAVDGWANWQRDV